MLLETQKVTINNPEVEDSSESTDTLRKLSSHQIVLNTWKIGAAIQLIYNICSSLLGHCEDGLSAQSQQRSAPQSWSLCLVFIYCLCHLHKHFKLLMYVFLFSLSESVLTDKIKSWQFTQICSCCVLCSIHRWAAAAVTVEHVQYGHLWGSHEDSHFLFFNIFSIIPEKTLES